MSSDDGVINEVIAYWRGNQEGSTIQRDEQVGWLDDFLWHFGGGAAMVAAFDPDSALKVGMEHR